ncbi:MAG: acetate--CoA ligase family protein, partial [Desulfobacterales bacterium]
MNSTSNIISEALAAGQMTLSEYDSKKILAEYGIPTTEEFLIDELAAAKQAAEQIGYPVALKVCAAAAQHKTEQNLIELGIGNADELKKAYDRLAPKARELGGAILVQEMIRGSRELVAGLNRDAQFGPCVMFGLGGIFTEALGDVVFRVAPLNREDAREMTTDIKAAKILGGLRGLEPVHIDELSNCLQQLGQIAIDHPAVCEIDINPLIVRKGHPVAVDALIVLQEPPPPATTEKAVTGNLTKFFEPQSVAVIGASGTPHKAGNDVIQNILANEFEGRLYLVNPKGGEILGH